jgi:hypothetical protein
MFVEHHQVQNNLQLVHTYNDSIAFSMVCKIFFYQYVWLLKLLLG